MIPRTVPTWQGQSWQEQLIDSIRNLEELCQLLSLRPQDLPGFEPIGSRQAIEAFPLKVPRFFASLMNHGDPLDPLLLQVLPQSQEMVSVPGYELDPLHETVQTDTTSSTQLGTIHKYRSRVLLMVSSACAVHCRYCFRRHFPYSEHQRSSQQWLDNLDEIRKTPEVNEIILSGGDPLSANDRFLTWLVEQIAELPNIRTLRLHTRLPVVLPSRIQSGFVSALSHFPHKKVMVLHANHPAEISQELTAGIQTLRESNVHVLNQSVLLKGINDNAGTLVKLSEALFQADIMPYYLHLLDKVSGTHHFDVTEKRALELHKELSGQLPGYLVPRLAREIPGQHSKTVLA